MGQYLAYLNIYHFKKKLKLFAIFCSPEIIGNYNVMSHLG